MFGQKEIAFAFCFVISCALVEAQLTGPGFPDKFAVSKCLGCICEGSTECRVTGGCTSGEGYFCGPFLIGWSYWADAGKPVLDGDDANRNGAFENCVNDLHCSARTVRRYMERYQEDCNRDGIITCEDLARIHYLGGTECHKKHFDRGNLFQSRFNRCFTTVKKATSQGSVDPSPQNRPLGSRLSGPNRPNAALSAPTSDVSNADRLNTPNEAPSPPFPVLPSPNSQNRANILNNGAPNPNRRDGPDFDAPDSPDSDRPSRVNPGFSNPNSLDRPSSNRFNSPSSGVPLPDSPGLTIIQFPASDEFNTL